MEANEIDRIRQDLDRLIRGHRTKRPQSQVAKALGVKADHLAKFLLGTYDGDVERMAEAGKAYLQQQGKPVPQAQRITNVVDTTVYRRLRDTSEFCFQGKMGLAWGLAGIGKTSALEKLAAEDPSIMLLSCYPGYSCLDVLADICKQLKAFCTYGISSLMFSAIKLLKGSGRLIVVDEANYLNINGLDTLRRLHDLSGVGVLLVGMPDLYNKFRDLPNFRQIDNRIRVRVPLEVITLTDAKAIIAANTPACTKVANHLYNLCGGDARRLESLIDITMRLSEANKVLIDTEVCDEAHRYLEGT